MVKIQTGIGVNVHSELIDLKLIQPFFSFVRFDLAGFNGKIVDVVNHYSPLPEPILWIVRNYKDVLTLDKYGVKSAIIDAINEPNLAFPGRPAFSPTDYIAALKLIYRYSVSCGYTVVGGNVSDWGPNIDSFFYPCLYKGLLKNIHVLGSHPYDVQIAQGNLDVNNLLWNRIHILKTAFPDLPLLFTEYGNHPLPSLVTASGQVLSIGIKEQATRLAKVIHQAQFENIGFVVYDMPFTDSNCSLLDPSGNPSELYKALQTAY